MKGECFAFIEPDNVADIERTMKERIQGEALSDQNSTIRRRRSSDVMTVNLYIIVDSALYEKYGFE